MMRLKIIKLDSISGRRRHRRTLKLLDYRFAIPKSHLNKLVKENHWCKASKTAQRVEIEIWQKRNINGKKKA